MFVIESMAFDKIFFEFDEKFSLFDGGWMTDTKFGMRIESVGACFEFNIIG